MAEHIQANHHYAKCQPKDRQPHSYRPIAIRQQGSMRTTGHTQLYIVAITTDVVSSNLVQVEVYNIM
jgi:hypothetical protein